MTPEAEVRRRGGQAFGEDGPHFGFHRSSVLCGKDTEPGVCLLIKTADRQRRHRQPSYAGNAYNAITASPGPGRPSAQPALRQLGSSPSWPVAIMFAIAFGLSMDYEVFLLTRVREMWARTHGNRTATGGHVADAKQPGCGPGRSATSSPTWPGAPARSPAVVACPTATRSRRANDNDTPAGTKVGQKESTPR